MQAKDPPLEFTKNVPLPNNGAYLQWAWPLDTAQLANLSEGLSVEAGVLFEYGEWNGRLSQDLSYYWNSPDIEGYS